MTTKKKNVTTTPQDLVADLSLIVGTGYNLQNVSDQNILYSEKATIPDFSSDPHHVLKALESVPIVPDTGLGIWVATSLGNANIAITEAA